jgi:hypothetical protein
VCCRLAHQPKPHRIQVKIGSPLTFDALRAEGTGGRSAARSPTP